METYIVLDFLCPFCGDQHFVEVKLEDLENYENGMLAQDAFPNLTATEREQIISHICPACQEMVFGPEDDN